MEISKLDDISKNFEKKRLPVSKKVVNLHPDTNQLKHTTMKTRNIPTMTKERAKQIILNSSSDITREMVDNYSDTEIKEFIKHLGFKVKFNF